MRITSRFMVLSVLALLMLLPPSAGAQDALVFDPWQNDFTPVTGKAQAPGDAQGFGPWATRVMLAVSTDGLDFTRTMEIVADQAGVPAVLVDHDGYTRIYYQAWQNNDAKSGNEGNFMAMAIKNPDTGQWFYHRLFLDKERGFAVDPYVILLDDGRFRLFYMEDEGGFSLRIYSATSEDGKNFIRDEGYRLAPDDPIFDPMVLKTSQGYILIAGPDGSYYATSTDGLNFELQGAFVVQGRQFMAWSGTALPENGGYRLYGNYKDEGMLSSVLSTDGITWTAEEGARLPHDGSDPSLEQGVMPDNGAGLLADGTYLMAYLTVIPE